MSLLREKASGPKWRSGRSPATPVLLQCAPPYPTPPHSATHFPTTCKFGPGPGVLVAWIWLSRAADSRWRAVGEPPAEAAESRARPLSACRPACSGGRCRPACAAQRADEPAAGCPAARPRAPPRPAAGPTARAAARPRAGSSGRPARRPPGAAPQPGPRVAGLGGQRLRERRAVTARALERGGERAHLGSGSRADHPASATRRAARRAPPPSPPPATPPPPARGRGRPRPPAPRAATRPPRP